MLYCHPARDVLPAPEACLLTGITPQAALERGVCEAEFIARIHQELAQPGTCALGYNSLRFDDEVTRNTLYRNLYDPYEREWRNGNSRWDLIDTVRAAAALRPEGLEWPHDEQGRPSFRLEHLTAANGIVHDGAHDALADVRATIELARLLRARQPRLFNFLWQNRGKQEARALLCLGEYRPLLHVSEKYPADRYCLAVVVALARHPDNPNGVIVFDLSMDPSPLLELDEEEIRCRLYTKTSELPAGMERIPLKTVHVNRCPVLAPMNVLRPGDIDRLRLDLSVCEKNLDRIRRAGALADKVARVFAASPSQCCVDDDPDLLLYRGGFYSDADRRSLAAIRELSPQALAGQRFAFDDPRLETMLFRYRARNWPETLSEEEHQRWEEDRRQRLSDAVLMAYRERLDCLAAVYVHDREKLAIIDALRAWEREIFS